jgi:hypothetical protein
MSEKSQRSPIIIIIPAVCSRKVNNAAYRPPVEKVPVWRCKPRACVAGAALRPEIVRSGPPALSPLTCRRYSSIATG